MLPIAELSVVKVFVEVKNPLKNKVSVKLVSMRDAGLIEAMDPKSDSILTVLSEQVLLEIVYEQVDPSDPCPTFDLRVAVQPFSQLESQEMAC